MNDGSMMSGDSSPGFMDAMMTMPDASAGDAMMVDPELCDPDDLRLEARVSVGRRWRPRRGQERGRGHS